MIARGVKQGLLDVRVRDLRDYASDRHRSTDDEAYGGGPGMVMLAEPVLRCVEAIGGGARRHDLAAGAAFRPGRGAASWRAREQSSFLCGRYEGFDQRVHEALQPDEISIGDFVVSGGELPAMLIADAVGRMIEGVVGNSGSVEEDSFFRRAARLPALHAPRGAAGDARARRSCCPATTRRSASGGRSRRLRATLAKRPDLLETAELDDEARAMLSGFARNDSADSCRSEPRERLPKFDQIGDPARLASEHRKV